jgi:polysaccharide export outer membrane protein
MAIFALFQRIYMLFRRALRSHTLLIFTFFVSCKAYKQDVLFQLPEDTSKISTSVYDAESNYRIRPNDWLEVFLFYKDGELLINPNAEVMGERTGNQLNQNRQRFKYLVQMDGTLKLPMVGTHSIAGLTIDEAERMLEGEYDKIYKGSFLKISFLNKRVTVLGTVNRVIPIENENTSLLEVLALAGGIQFGSKAQNIRVLRGDLSNPEIFLIDLTTTEAMRDSMLTIVPGDVIYIEPWRRPWLQTLRDISPVIGVTSSVTTLVFLLVNSLNNG